MIQQKYINGKNGKICTLVSYNDKCTKGILYFHGFGHNKCETGFIYSRIARELLEMGYASCQFDFCGFGDSEGDTKNVTFETLLQDAKICFNYLDKIYPISIFVSCGIGSSIAAYLLKEHKNMDFICLSPKFAPYADSTKLGIKNSEIIEIADYLDSVKVNNYFRSLGASSGNIGGYQIGRSFLCSFLEKDPVKEIGQYARTGIIINSDTDLNLRTISYGRQVDKLSENKKIKQIIIDDSDRFFKNAKTQDEILDIIKNHIKDY